MKPDILNAFDFVKETVMCLNDSFDELFDGEVLLFFFNPFQNVVVNGLVEFSTFSHLNKVRNKKMGKTMWSSKVLSSLDLIFSS